MEFKLVSKDNRREIWVISSLLSDNKEFSIINLKPGKGIGGCRHKNDEFYTVVKGPVRILIGNDDFVAESGESGVFGGGQVHGFVALDDKEAIVAEWGISAEEKESDIKDPRMKAKLDKING